MGATFAAIRLQRLVGPQVGRIGKGAALTARELAVLRLLSMGHHVRQVAGLLELGEETVRSHLKKAEAKLGVHDRNPCRSPCRTSASNPLKSPLS